MKVCVPVLFLSTFPFVQSIAEPLDGKQLFDKKCSVCHAADSAERRIGPSLKGVKEGKLPDAIGTLATHDSILKQINNGGNGMPVFRELLTKEEKEAIVAYVLTL